MRPSHLPSLVNYALHLHTVAHDYAKAGHVFEQLVEPGAHHPVVLFARALFLAATCEEDEEEVKYLVGRAKDLDPSGRKFRLAALGFYRQPAYEVRSAAAQGCEGPLSPLTTGVRSLRRRSQNPHNARCLLNYAVCLRVSTVALSLGSARTDALSLLQYYAGRVEDAEEYLLRAMACDHHDWRVEENYRRLIAAEGGDAAEAGVPADRFLAWQRRVRARCTGSRREAYRPLLTPRPTPAPRTVPRRGGADTAGRARAGAGCAHHPERVPEEAAPAAVQAVSAARCRHRGGGGC